MKRRALWQALLGALGAAGAVGAYVLSPAGTSPDGNPSGGKRGCELAITAPVLEPGGIVRLGAGDSLNVTLQGTALRCPSTTVTMFAKVGAAAETQVGTPSTNASGVWSFGYTATDGATTVLRAQMTSAAGKTTSTSVSLVADTAKPKIVVTSPAPDDWGRVRIVAPAADAGCGSGGNVHADRGEPGWVYDKGCAAGGQVDPTITVTGGSPGTLTVWYADAGIASAEISASPQTLTSAELGQWTLPEWTRSDLVITAAGPSGTTVKTLMARVATSTPPMLLSPDGGVGGPFYEIKDKRHADVDVSFQLPQPPPEVLSSTITVTWTTSTRLMSANVALGSVALTSTPTAMPAVPGTCSSLTIANSAVADAGIPVWCAIDNPSPGNDAGVRIAPVLNGSFWSQGSNTAGLVLPDAGWQVVGPGCTQPSEAKATVHCVAQGSVSVTATAIGCCLERTRAVFDDARYGTTVEACQYYDGVWTCADGTTRAPGDSYTVHLTWLPPLNAYYFQTDLTW